MMENTWSAVVHPNKVIVNRDERQRKELIGIDELASSILRRGQLQPIVVTRDLVLIAGERRLTAIRKLAESNPDSHFHVKVVFSDELDPAELQALELEENIKRVDLPWKDNCAAIYRYHTLQVDRDPAWTMGKTAESLGISVSGISERISIAKELLAGNTMVANAPKLSTAKGIVTRQNERKEAAQASQLMALISPKPIKADPDSSAQPEGGPPSSQPPSGTGFIINEDFKDWAQNYDSAKFNLIHCDFPYGVGMHKSDQGSGAAHGTYEDTPDIYWSLVETLLNHLDNFAEESAHLIFWFSMDYYEKTRELLGTRFRVNPFPLVWHKSDGAGIIPDANRGPRRTYETAFFASRGDRKIVRAVANSVASPIHRGRHMSEKPQDVLRHFFRMVVDEHSSVLDPTCGSGSAIRAAVASGASRFLGLEINKEFADHADELLAADLEQLEQPML
jgi:hypothetical protein